MNSRTTWFLLLLACGLGTLVWWLERRPPVATVATAHGRIPFEIIDPASIESVEVARSNVVLRVAWTNGAWRMTAPIPYAAQQASVDRFLEEVGRLRPVGYIPLAQLAGGLPAFGLGGNAGTRLQLSRAQGSPVVLHLGGRAPLGSRFYFQREGDDGVFLAESAFLESLPAGPSEWRDRALLEIPDGGFDRLEVLLRGGVHFEAVRAADGWQLRRPLSARADPARIQTLLVQLAATRVVDFVGDTDGGDPAAYGLEAPEAELVLGRSGQEVLRLDFGGPVAAEPSLRNVRRGPQGNVVRVPAEVLAPLQRPVNDYRDRRILPGLDGVDRIELLATNTFLALRRGTNWMVEAPARFPAHEGIMTHFLDRFAGLEVVEFVNDVVAEPARYGFDRPVRDYLLARGTNAVARLQVGGPVPGSNGVLVHARRTDEPAVYAVPVSVLTQLASASVQLRDWRFAPTNVQAVLIRQGDRARRLERRPEGWRVAGEPAARLVDDALDETLHQLGRVESARYAIPDADAFVRAARVDEVAHRVEIQFGPGVPLRRWELNFGGRIANHVLVLARFDDDPTPLRLEVPEDLYAAILRDFGAPAPAGP